MREVREKEPPSIADRIREIKAQANVVNIKIRKAEAELAEFCFLDLNFDPKGGVVGRLGWDAKTKNIVYLGENLSGCSFAVRAKMLADIPALILQAVDAMEKNIGIKR